jgi:hypothetical protein
MMMTKKDYVIIAERLSYIRGMILNVEYPRNEIVLHMADRVMKDLKVDNPRFDEVKFFNYLIKKDVA